MPRTRTSAIGAFSIPPIWIPTRRLNLLLLVKWISSYFLGANFIPCFCAHCSSFLWTRSSFLQFSSVDSEYASRFVSSANPIPETPSQGRLQISCNSTVYSKKRIGDKGEPCGT